MSTTPSAKLAHCRTCRAPIVWALTQKGNREPLDFEPVADGNIEVVDWTRTPEEDEWTPVVRHLKKGELDVLPGFDVPDRYKSHFATCSDPAKHRKPR